MSHALATAHSVIQHHSKSFAPKKRFSYNKYPTRILKTTKRNLPHSKRRLRRKNGNYLSKASLSRFRKSR